MLVRLAFAVMVQADTDIMLVDEVLAVGDMAFAQKCMDVFYEKRDAGKTIVLVSHDMGSIQSLCHRAMLIHNAELAYIGEPEEVAMRYYRLNFAEGGADAPGAARLPFPTSTRAWSRRAWRTTPGSRSRTWRRERPSCSTS